MKNEYAYFARNHIEVLNPELYLFKTWVELEINGALLNSDVRINNVLLPKLTNSDQNHPIRGF